jgi:hypothetical protein
MARQESAREDLFAEATALVERAELVPANTSGDIAADAAEPIVVGFRRSGAASVFFGQDAAYHFNSANELRRAYLAGRLYKADRIRLAVLDRQRTADAVQLLRHDLNSEETVEFLHHLHRRLDYLRTALFAQGLKVSRQAPEGQDLAARVADWLATLPEQIAVARNPRVD